MADETHDRQDPQVNDSSNAGRNISVGGNVGGNIIQGDGNTININTEREAFRSLHQLPQPPADFTGREELIAQLVSDFTTHKGAAISGLTGMGGIGKTALGLMAAHKIAPDYPDAQVFLDLKGTTTPLSALEIICHVLLSLEPGLDVRALSEENMRGYYLSVLHGKRVLLFLDNARSAEQIEPLRPPDPCAMLVTSRWTFPVPGLHNRRLDVLSEEDAEQLLLALCPRINDKAAELAHACAYLPLALRVAGSFLQVNDNWKAEKYIAQFHDRKQRLATLHNSHAEAELKTEPDLLAAFELSYGCLSQDEQNRWRTLGVFPTSFDSQAAQAMWEMEEDETLKLLSFYLRYSLLDYDENASRYSLHDLLVDYACSQMGEQEEHEARQRHASHYKDVLGAADELYLKGGENILAGLRLFDLEWENIRAGHAWASAGHRDHPQAAELCLQYPDAGVYVLDLRQHPQEKIGWLEEALSSAREIGDRRGEGNALGNLGNAYADLGDACKAIEFYEQALMIDREIGDRQGEGTALGNLGSAYAALGDARKAIEFYEKQLVIVREIGDRRGEGADLGNLGNAYAALGDARKAIEFYEQILVIHREIGDRRGEGADLGNLGLAYAALGDARKAIEFYEQRMVIAREIGDRRGEGAALGNLGSAYAALGDARKAIEFYEQALVIDREIGDRRGEGADLGNLGSAYADLGDARKAIEFYEQQLVIVREIGDRRGEGNALGNLGLAYADLGDARKAIEFYEQQLVIVREIGDRRGEGNALFNMGLALYDLEEKDRAVDLVKQALAIYETIESPYAERARNTLREWGVLPGEGGNQAE